MTNPKKRDDTATVKRVELSVHTHMSTMDSVLSLQELIRTATCWGWKAVAITDYGSVQAFPDAMRIIQRRNFDIKVIYGMEGFLTDDDYVNSPVNRITILAKNNTGMNNLYKLVSLSHIQYFHHRPLLPKRVLESHREGLILGSSGIDGKLIQAIVSHKDDEELLQIADFYDYLEIQPTANYSFLLTNEQISNISSDEDLRDINRRIVDISKRINKMAVATGDIHYLNSMDAMSLNIIRHEIGNTQNEIRASRYLRTTDEMLTSFDYLGSQTAYEAVVVNSNRISDMIENLTSVMNESYLPVLPNADEEIKKIAHQQANKIYGQRIPQIVRNRMEKELSIIVEHRYSSLYIISQNLTYKFNDAGYITCSRGSVGSSLIAYLLGITEVNPLPPHYRCPKCKHSIFIIDGTYASGFDLPNKECPNCGAELIKDGHDIPYATFLAFNGSKKPDIDLNFSGEQPVFHRYVQELMGKNKVYGAGIVETVNYIEAQSVIVQQPCDMSLMVYP